MAPKEPRPETAPESTEAPVAPPVAPPHTPPHTAELSFTFSFILAPPPPSPPPPADGAVAAGPVPAASLDGTLFVLRMGEGEGAQAFELSHSHSGQAASDSAATVTVTEPLVRWLVARQGFVELALCRRAAEGAAAEVIFALPLDVSPLLFGWPRLEATLSAAASTLPAAALPLVSSLIMSLSAGLPFLPAGLALSLNPTSVTVLRADGLPAAYSGTPFKAPFTELAEKCAPVFVSWRALGQDGVTGSKPHAEEIVWQNERRLFLAGDLGLDALRRSLREDGIAVEVHDRDPKPPPPPPQADGVDGDAADRGGAAAGMVNPNAPAPRHPPFGVARYRLGEMVGRLPTDFAPYAPSGIRSAPSRRLMLCLDVQPCERPRTRPEPEEEGVEYFSGGYVESGCQVTLQLDMAAELPPESQVALRGQADAELHRLVSLIHYSDTLVLRAVLDTVEEVNSACGLTSAANWENYKDAGKDDLDVISGVQLVDGLTRLLMLEGHAAVFAEDGRPLNGMARLSILLERTVPNSKTAFTLMDRRMAFPRRCYNRFELPMKLIKLRMPLPEMILRPEIYQHLRVSDACRDSVLTLAKLLASPTLRVAYKHGAFPVDAHLLELEKRFGAVVTIQDREGVLLAGGDSDSVFSSARGSTRGSVKSGAPSARSGAAPSGRSAAPSASGSGTEFAEEKPQERLKAPTDARNPLYLQALAERAAAPPLDYIRLNIVALPRPMEKAPLPDWYLESIEAVRLQLGGQLVGTYSGQRLNPTELQKAHLQKSLRAMGSAKGLGEHGRGVHFTYSADYPTAESMGELEVRPAPPPPQKPWDVTHREMRLHDGTRSAFEIYQPSMARREDLQLPWGVEQYDQDARGREWRREATAKKRFDALPSKQKYIAPDYPGQSVFQKTEEQTVAEGYERKQGAIESWSAKVVVDDPVLRVSLKSRDHVTQLEKLHGALHDAPAKASIKALYRGKHKLRSGNHVAEEPSLFMHESTVDGIAAFENSLRERAPEKWTSARLTDTTGDLTIHSTTAARGQSHSRIHGLDFHSGHAILKVCRDFVPAASAGRCPNPAAARHPRARHPAAPDLGEHARHGHPAAH